MKVVFVTPKFYPSIGGVERHSYEIAKRLRELGNEVRIVTELSPKIKHSKKNNYQSRAQSDTKDIKIRKGVKSIYFDTFEVENISVLQFKFGRPGFFKKFRIWYLLIKNRNFFEEADVIHFHDVFIWYLPLRFLLRGKKVYITFHGYESYPVKIKAIVIRKLAQFLTNGNICVGDYIKKWYKTKPDKIIYGAVNLPKSFKRIEKPSALFYGRLDEQTGIVEYLEGVELIRKKYPSFIFSIIGDGPFKKKINPEESILPPSILAKDELNRYRYAFVSRYLSVLEAMAAKKLTFVMYDNPLKKDCFVLSPFKKYIVLVSSPQELEKKVDYYLNHPEEEKEIIDKGFNWVQNQSWDKVVDTYLNLWKKS